MGTIVGKGVSWFLLRLNRVIDRPRFRAFNEVASKGQLTTLVTILIHCNRIRCKGCASNHRIVRRAILRVEKEDWYVDCFLGETTEGADSLIAEFLFRTAT